MDALSSEQKIFCKITNSKQFSDDGICANSNASANGVARNFVWGGGHPVPFSVISPGADRIQWGGGG